MWVLDADLAAAFDRIDHDHLLGQLGTFPARELIAGWLKAGVVEKGRFAPTGEGTPQGGVVSPAAAERGAARDGDTPPESATSASAAMPRSRWRAPRC